MFIVTKSNTNLLSKSSNQSTIHSTQQTGKSIALDQNSNLQWRLSSPSYKGALLTIITGFIGPYGLHVSPEGQLFVCDLKEGRIIRFTNDLQFDGWMGLLQANPPNPSGWHYSGESIRGREYGALQMPHSIDFKKDGKIFIADYENDRILFYDKDANFLGYFNDNPKDGTLKFIGPPSALFDIYENLWISDFDGNRIYKYDKNLNFIGWIGAKNDGTPSNGFIKTGTSNQSTLYGAFYKPHMVRVDKQGNFYTVESGNNRIQRFSADGTFTGWIGAKNDGTLTNGWQTIGESAPSDKPGGFNQPVSLFLTNDDLMLIADNGNNRVQKFSLNGKFLGWIGGKTDGTVTNGWEMSGLSSAGTEPGTFDAPFDAQIFNNKLFVADGHNGRIQIFSF